MDQILTRPLPFDGQAFAPRGDDNEPTPIARYLKIVTRWRWLVLGAVVAGVLLALLITLATTRIYTATATLEILREEAKIVEVDGVEPKTTASDIEFYQTQYGLLRARELAERVVRKLGLARNDAMLELYDAKPSPSWFNKTQPSPAEQVADRERRVIAIVQREQEVIPGRNSRLVTIGFNSPDPQLSKRVVDAWSEAFIASNLERRFAATAYARRFLEARLGEVRGRLEDSERQAVDYATRQRIINVAGPVDSSGRSTEQALVATDLTAINEALNAAVADRVAAQSRMGKGNRSTTESVTNELISGLRRKRADVIADISRLAAQYKPDYPPLATLRSQVAVLDRQIGQEEGRLQDSVASQRDSAVQRERILQGRVDELKNDYLDNRRRTIQYAIFQRDVDTNRTLYDGLLQRYKEIGIAGGVGTNNVSVADRAIVPTAPTLPRPLINLVIGFLAGLFAGILAAFIMEQLDETVSNPEQLEGKLNLPALGSVPLVREGSLDEAFEDAKSPISEAYFSILSNLRFSTAQGLPKLLLVTSGMPGEGKSTSSRTLARNIARSGATVLLVDGDLRNPSLHRMQRIKNEAGFSDLLTGTELSTGMLHQTGVAGLTLLTAGETPPAPAQLLSGENPIQVLDALARDFDHIVIDGPPVLGLADAPLLANCVDGVVFVVEAHRARARVLQNAIRRLLTARAVVVGAILTKFEPRRSAEGYGADYGYSYSYTYGNDRGAEST